MTVEITLPDQLALEAREAGLLVPELLEGWLQEQLRAKRLGTLLEAMDRMSAVSEPRICLPRKWPKRFV